MRELAFRVLGTPAKQGSKVYKGMRGKRPVFVEADEKLPQWREDVAVAAHNAMRAVDWLTSDAPCEVWVTFLLPKPRTTTREFPSSKFDGDSDKYVRGLFDALTLAGVWADDSRVVDHHASKRWAGSAPAGAIVRVVELAEVLL